MIGRSSSPPRFNRRAFLRASAALGLGAVASPAIVSEALLLRREIVHGTFGVHRMI